MPYEISYPWKNNPRLLKVYFLEVLTSQEFTESLEEIASVMDYALMPLHVIMDFDSMTAGPEDILQIFSHCRLPNHKMMGYCVFLNPDQFLSFVAKVLNNKLGMQVHVSSDDDDAWEFFNQLGLC
ncbi:MAG: hypothetical protein K8I82_04945 [Anaerolineae bacterium]|nr:hypothetical protein [Anaerolineae bacterium]